MNRTVVTFNREFLQACSETLKQAENCKESWLHFFKDFNKENEEWKEYAESLDFLNEVATSLAYPLQSYLADRIVALAFIPEDGADESYSLPASEIEQVIKAIGERSISIAFQFGGLSADFDFSPSLEKQAEEFLTATAKITTPLKAYLESKEEPHE